MEHTLEVVRCQYALEGPSTQSCHALLTAHGSSHKILCYDQYKITKNHKADSINSPDRSPDFTLWGHSLSLYGVEPCFRNPSSKILSIGHILKRKCGISVEIPTKAVAKYGVQRAHQVFRLS